MTSRRMPTVTSSRVVHHLPSRRRPLHLPREAGPSVIVGLAVALAAQWLLLRPSGQPTGSFLGQLVGAEAILLLSTGLVLISTLPWIEVFFDGIDRAAIWHRRVAITGLLLLIPHILLSTSPEGTALGGPLGAVGAIGMTALALWAILPRWRSVVPAPLRGLVLAARDAPLVRDVRRMFGGYERWRALHRTTGLFVAAAFAHGALDGTPFDGAPTLRVTYLAIGGIGLAFYVYREVLAAHLVSLHDYQVAEVRPVGDGLTEIVLRPLGRTMAFHPGQFALVYLEAKDGWHRHPFTISSAPHEGVVRLTVKALGDYTTAVPALVEPGMPAVIGGPHGRFDHHRGTTRQLWIAGGVGIAPFLSWMRTLERTPVPHERVDLFYSNAGPAPFADELVEIAAGRPEVHVHVIDTTRDPRLTTEQLLQAADTDPRALSVFMCGPTGMLRGLQRDLTRAGVHPRRIHHEYFDWR